MESFKNRHPHIKGQQIREGNKKGKGMRKKICFLSYVDSRFNIYMDMEPEGDYLTLEGD